MFIDNKYKLWHDNIIANAQSRILKGYKEKHHILPRSVGGTDDKSNLVELTAKEHFIVHMLLCKFTKGLARRSMLYAFKAMSYYKKDGRDYKINSRIAEKLRSELKFSDEHKQKMSEKKLGRIIPIQTKLKMSLQHIKNTYLKNKNINFKDGGKHRVIIHKGTKTRRVNLENIKNYLEMGYKLGRYRPYFTKQYINEVNKLTQEYWNRRLA
jgi:hypothetical protein